MELKPFECGSCAYLIFVGDGQEAPEQCPLCRSPMYASPGAEERPGEKVFECGACAYSFRTPDNVLAPYKCAVCNCTFPSTPRRRVDHKL